MEGKTAFLISCSDHYKFRLHVVDKCLRDMGWKTVYLTSNYDHDTKAVFQSHVEGSIQIPVRPYKKNLSADRILSHREFAKKAFQHLESLQTPPDMIFVHIPPNFLAHYAAKYKKRHPEVKLVFDIFDLWPETFPGGKIKKLLAPAFSVWGALRDRNLSAAEYTITECEMFRQMLGLGENSCTVWQCAPALPEGSIQPQLPESELALCYLGSINNIISIPDICGVIKELAAQKKVVLHIIGKGERQEEFVEQATAAGAEVVFHGPIYDEAQKLAIMNGCHFGLNIMKSSVCVGLTMKSVDYFRFGLPIINNIPGDTRQLVQEQGIGVQLEPGCADKLLAMDNDCCKEMRKRVETLFSKGFDEAVVLERYRQAFSHIEKEGSK